MNSWKAGNTPDGAGEPVLVASTTDTGMVSAWMSSTMVWVTPETAERMASALINAAREIKGRR